MADARAPRVGVVGAGRRRNGLGPFLIRALEAAGGQVVAIAGRDAERTGATAAALATELGHPVAAHAGAESMTAAGDLDAIVIAAPVGAHLPALRAALAAGVPTLCEKPLVAPEEHAAGLEVVAGYRARDLLLMENCQWPETLEGFAALHPGVVSPAAREGSGATPSRFAMRLSPSGRGRDMLVDSLSHFLSMLQALAPVDASTRIARAELSTRAADATSLVLELALERPFARLDARFEVERCPEQPRPAWYAIDGHHAAREIEMPEYRMSLVCGERAVSIRDPLPALVYRFVRSVRQPDIERVRAETDAVRDRARLFRDVLAVWEC